MHSEDIQKLGAKAARDGLTQWDSPYYRAIEMPGHTGESIAEWRSKIEAWEAGRMNETKSWLPPPGGQIRYMPSSKARRRN